MRIAIYIILKLVISPCIWVHSKLCPGRAKFYEIDPRKLTVAMRGK